MSDIKDGDENENMICTNIYSSKDNQSLHKSLNSEFILYQILLERLLDETQELTNEKCSMLEYFKPTNPIDERMMNEFDEEYKSSQAIYWLTRESCIQEILNKSLLTQNLSNIFKYSKFIKDLFQQLKIEHQLFIEQQKSSIIIVYSGKWINKNEFKRLKSNQGQLISMNSFLSTTRNKEKVLEEFSSSSSSSGDQFKKILFEIFINIQSPHLPLADIKHLSAFGEEEEIIFMFGSIFRIDQIEYDNNMNLFLIKLTLCGENDSDMKHFFSTLNSQLNGKNKQISLGFYLFQMQKYSQAEEYYKKLLENKRFNQANDLAYLHHGLSQINHVKAEYKSAIQNLNKATDYLIEYPNKNDEKLLSQCYNDLAKVYYEEKNYLLAFYYYNKALKTKHNDQIRTYHGLAEIHFKLENYFLSLEYLEKALDHQSLNEYSSIANTFIHMANVYGQLNDKDKSIKMFNKAIETQLKMFNCEHPDLSYTYIAQSKMFLHLNDKEKALDFIEKAYQIQLEYLPENHIDFSETFKNFADFYMKLNDLDNALSYYHKYLENQLKNFSWKDSIIAEIYFIIGKIYWKKKDYDQALIYFYLLFQNQIEKYSFGNPFLSLTYENIAQIYLEKKDFDHSADYYLKLLHNELVNKFYEDFSLCDIYKILAKIFYKKRLLSQSLLYYNRLLNCHLNHQPFNQLIIDEIFHKIGKIYLKKKYFHQTLLIYKHLKYKSFEKKSSLDLYKDIQNIYFEKRHLEQTRIFFENHLEQQIKQYSSDNPIIGKIYRILGNIYFEQNNYDQASNYFLKFLNNQLTRKYFHHSSLKNLYQILANIYYKQRKYDRALDYFYRLLDCLLEKRSLDDYSVLNSFIMIGKIFLKKHYFNQTSNYFNKLFDTTYRIDSQFEKYHLDQSLFYFKKFLEKRPKNNSYVFNIDSLYTIIAYIHLQKQEPYQALHYFHLLINYQLQKQPHGNLSIAMTYSILGDIYFKLRDFQTSLQFYQTSLAIYQRIYPKTHSAIITLKYKIRDAFFPLT